MKRQSLLLIALLAAPAAFAEGNDGWGPYAVNPDLTTGSMEFFREVYVDPETVASQLTPKAPLPAPEGSDPAGGEAPKALNAKPFGELHLTNGISASVDVTVNGTKVGRIGPLTTAIMHDMKSGVYDITMTAPNGMVITRTVATQPREGSPIKRDPAVTPEPLREGTPPAE